jgi:prophage tail gpP-like protein
MTVELRVGGNYFGGWESTKINLGVEQLAGTFDLTVTDCWNTEQGQQVMQIKPGQACEALINGKVVITGYVDDTGPHYDKRSHSISVTGRDKTGDLVDCSAIYKSGQWSNKKLEQIAADLCSPFGIKVITNTDTGEPFASFSIQEGETVFETLDRAARMRAVILMSNGLGNLLITRAGRARAPAGLTEGDNILMADGTFGWKDRFSHYIVKGQAQGDDNNYGETVAHAVATVEDTAITRYRPLIIIAEDQGSNATLRQRAEWERNVRAGRGTRATVTVQDWEVGGQLWLPNTVTHLSSPKLYADMDVLIASVNFSQDDETGTTAAMQLALPSAFDTIEGVKQTRLDKKMRKKQGKDHGITQPEWEFPQ